MENINYIEKLKDSMSGEELNQLLPSEITEAMDLPRFKFGISSFYPREDFNRRLMEAYTTGADTTSDTDSLRERIEELEKEKASAVAEANAYVEEITRLESELKHCKEALEATRKMPKKNYAEAKVDFVSDKELYTGEMMAALFSALTEYAKNNKPDTATRSNRAYIMAEELIKKFPVEVMASIQKEGVKFRSEIERAVDKAYDGSNVDISPLTAIGFVDVTRDRSKHFKLTYGDNKELTFTVSRTPSAHTSRENCKRSITSRMCIV